MALAISAGSAQRPMRMPVPAVADLFTGLALLLAHRLVAGGPALGQRHARRDGIDCSPNVMFSHAPIEFVASVVVFCVTADRPSKEELAVDRTGGGDRSLLEVTVEAVVGCPFR